MSTLELKKQIIIKELELVEDEWIINALERLLKIDNDSDIPEWHKKILDECLIDSENENELVKGYEVRKKFNR